MEVNVAITIKVETLFRGANVFREGAGNSTRGMKYFLLGRGNIPSPRNGGDSVMGETLFRDTGINDDDWAVGLGRSVRCFFLLPENIFYFKSSKTNLFPHCGNLCGKMFFLNFKFAINMKKPETFEPWKKRLT